MSVIRRSAFIATAVGAGALIWGSVERRLPVIRRFQVSLPEYRGIDPVKILHVSDLHMFAGQEFIIDFLQRVAGSEDIDFVISTGDNFGSPHALDLAVAAHEPFFHLPGAFVFGSNDYFSPRPKNWLQYVKGSTQRKPVERVPDLPFEDLASVLSGAGWVNANNASAALRLWKSDGVADVLGESPNARIALTGVDDPHIQRDVPAELPSTWGQSGVLSLGITHAPYQRVLDGWTMAGADLIVAGHTHGGQIGLPGVTSLVTNCDIPTAFGRGLHSWVVRDPSRYVDEAAGGLFSSWVHVSAGLGTSPFAPLRIATRPEVSLITVASV